MIDPITYYAFEVLYWTGIRRGEMLALTTADIDFEKQEITINKTYSRAERKDEITSPKTEKSNRIIKIPEFLCEELKDCIGMFYDMQPTDRIFESVSTHRLARAKKNACQAAGVKVIRIHDIRHSHTYMLANMGFPESAIAERLGYESTHMTWHYTHAYPERQNEMAGIINGLVRENEQLRVFLKNSLYLPTKKIGKNNLRANEIKENNRLRNAWNKQINIARSMGAPREAVMIVKKELISKPMKTAVQRGNGSGAASIFHEILEIAVTILFVMIKELRYADRDTWAKAWGEAIQEFIIFCREKAAGMQMNRPVDRHI